MKFKPEGRAVGHGLGKIQPRILGPARRAKGVTVSAPEGKRLLGNGFSIRYKLWRWQQEQGA